jgi:hypothetical protein
MNYFEPTITFPLSALPTKRSISFAGSFTAAWILSIIFSEIVPDFSIGVFKSLEFNNWLIDQCGMQVIKRKIR